jgi:SPP1 gp7 family putative phage head morphogenesis protein
MAKKPRVKQDITDATAALKQIMQENLAGISEAMIDQIMAAYKRLPESQRFAAINNVKAEGISVYKDALKNALAIIASKSLDKVRKEVPAKKNVRLALIKEDALRLGEYEKLPPDLRKRVDSMLKLLTGTQIADLEKVIFFQFSSSVDSTDSEELLNKDLTDAAGDYVTGNAIAGGASASASQIINEARLAFFLDKKVSEEIEAFEFVNGDPVSPICQALAGTVFSKDDPNLHRYWPPLHFNCKSYISAILTGNMGSKEIEDLKASPTAEKSIQFAEGLIDKAMRDSKEPRP